RRLQLMALLTKASCQSETSVGESVNHASLSTLMIDAKEDTYGKHAGEPASVFSQPRRTKRRVSSIRYCGRGCETISSRVGPEIVTTTIQMFTLTVSWAASG